MTSPFRKDDPFPLAGSYVRLEPLSEYHIEGLCAVAFDPEIWRWTTSELRNPGDVRAYVEAALRERDSGRSVPFATLALTPDGREVVAGSTRFGNIDVPSRRVEIGWTWIARVWQRSAVNTEAKYLMLRHAFEFWNCQRVEFKTDALNEPSRTAILRLGAREEGTFRKHMITASGRVRDSVYFSIVDDDWPEVKSRLESRLAAGPTGKV